MKIRLMIAACCLILGTGTLLQARTRLVVLPQRETAVLRLSMGLPTLVQEERILTLSKGVNPVDFSWQEVAIDPSSIILSPLAGPEEARLLSVSYPPGENALVWEVYSSQDRELPVVISYLIQGLDHLVTHEALADETEKTLTLSSFLVLRNFSGEDFEPARIFLDPNTAFDTASRNQETKQRLFFKVQNIPVVKRYQWHSGHMAHEIEPGQPKPGIPMGYEISNTPGAGLGTQNLAQGKARVFQKDGSGTTIFLGENFLEPLPVGDKTLLVLGDSRDIQVTLKPMKTEVTQVRKNKKGEVQVFDELREDQILVENFKNSPVTLTLTHIIPGQWEPLDMGHPYTLEDHQTLVFDIALDPGQKKTILLSYRRVNCLAPDRLSRYNAN